MKKAFGERTRGCSTPESKAEALKRHCHILCIKEDPLTGGILKYYSLEYFDVEDLIAEVTILNNRIVSVRNVKANAIKGLLPVNAPLFGNF